MADGKVVYEIVGDNSQFQRDINETEKIANGGYNKIQTVGKAAFTAIGAATVATTGFVAASVGVGSAFDKSMSQVAATMGVTVDEITDLRDFAQDMGATTAFSATQAADALNYMALAGYDAETSMNMLPNVLNLAAAGNIELARASDMVTDAQTALGLSLEETEFLVDEMAKTSSKSNTSVEQLGDAILTVGGNAKNLAGGTVELNQVLGLLADNGIKGSEAGTHLRNIMLAMTPTTDAAAAAFEQLGVDAYDAQGELRPMSAIFRDLSGAMEDISTEERTDIINSIFNKTDLAAVNALLDTSVDRWSELAVEITNSEGAAQAMANTQLDNLQGDVTLFKSALEGAQIAISDGVTPTLREFVQFGTEAIGTLSTAFQEGGLSGAMDALGTILSEGLNLIMQELPTFVDAGMQLLESLALGILDNLPTIVETALEIVLSLANGIAEDLPTLIPTIVEVILTIVDTLIENVDMLVDAAIAIIIALAQGLINALPQLIAKAPEIVASLVTALVKNAPKLVTAGVQLIRELIKGIGNMVKDFITVGENLLDGLKQGVKNKALALANSVKDAVKGAWEGAKKFLGINSPSKLFMQIGQYVDEGFAQGITSDAEAPKRSIRQMLGGITDVSVPTMPVTATAGGPALVSTETTASAGSAGNNTVVLQVGRTAFGQVVYSNNLRQDNVHGINYVNTRR